MTLESDFQSDLIKEIERLLPGCIVLKNDAGYLMGVPDLTILHGGRWAFLECKRSARASEQPLQRFYVEYAQENAFGAFIHPGNKSEVLDELQRAFGTGR